MTGCARGASRGVGIAALFLWGALQLVHADEASGVPAADAATDWYTIHAQATNVTQYHPRFHSPFRGKNSMDPAPRANETIDVTLYAGVRLWDGLEFYANPEVDQGFGLSNTLGAAGYPSGEAYKVGAANPYIRLPRAFFRYAGPRRR